MPSSGRWPQRLRTGRTRSTGQRAQLRAHQITERTGSAGQRPQCLRTGSAGQQLQRLRSGDTRSPSVPSSERTGSAGHLACPAPGDGPTPAHQITGRAQLRAGQFAHEWRWLPCFSLLVCNREKFSKGVIRLLFGPILRIFIRREISV